MSIQFTGTNTMRAASKVISMEDYEALEVMADEDTFNFKGDPVKFALFAEAERIHSAYQFDPLFAVNCSIVDPLPHQVEAVYKFLLPLPKIRFLLADDTGAGKTIMTGLLLKELLLRGAIERILIVTPGGLTKQWQEDEMGLKFNLPFTLVNRSQFNADPNIFQSAQRIITSIDFISQEDVMNVVSNSHWDMVIFDEAHKLSAYDYGAKVYKSKRYTAAQTLSHLCEHMLLLTATPHRGRADTFRKLLQLLDEDIFATDDLATERVQELEHGGNNRFFIRRLKEDMKDWEGAPLYKERFTKTVAYELTPEEKKLYDAVTDYLTKKKEEASAAKNIHVSLALTVMQRRLVSSIYAIKNTLEKRHRALQSIIAEVDKNPNLWNQRHKMEGFDVSDITDYEELPDEERDALENIMADPRKFKLFTTAKNPQEIHDEAREVKRLFEMADTLHKRQQEEQKFKELQNLLRDQDVFGGEKLVIFTEHKDTLLYLEDRLSKSSGFKVATIHGGKSVDERREAQWAFARPDTPILIATDAAGEGINLQFCRLLINWDIPWNPNRLEQRMGRIHRYGQAQDVLVFNLVARNTREGAVLSRLLQKMDIIREGIGDDRVYDVIQDVLEDISMSAIMDSVFGGKETAFTEFLAQDTEQLKLQVTQKIKAQREALVHNKVDYKEARQLKEDSDEKRLQPIYVQMFFRKAFELLGGRFEVREDHFFRITHLPDAIMTLLRSRWSKAYDLSETYFCFDKTAFLKQHHAGSFKHLYFLNPGNPFFDALIEVARNTWRAEMMKGTILVSADEQEDYFAFFVKSQITDNRPSKGESSVADEQLLLVYQNTTDSNFTITSPAKFIDLHPPAVFAKEVRLPAAVEKEEVVNWTFTHITQPQLEETRQRVEEDAWKRRSYLQAAFNQVITDVSAEVNQLQGQSLTDGRVTEKLAKKEERLRELKIRKESRLQHLDLMAQLAPSLPEVLGCAYVVPLSQVEYKGSYGMSRDDEAEAIAMQVAMDWEEAQGWTPFDASAENAGYDIRSVSPEGLKRYIEVKGRSADGGIMMSENEFNRLAQLGNAAWLYIVRYCKSTPQLTRIQNPVARLDFQMKTKGVQYFLPAESWDTAAENASFAP